MSSQEQKFYGSIFKTLDPKGTGLISGLAAKPLLEASGLPLNVLGEVWNLSDAENTGFLNQFGFCVAMRLIAHAQQGDEVSIKNANLLAPLAKFGTIQVNNTGSGVLKSHLKQNLSPSPQPRIASSNSVSSNTSNASSTNLIVPLLSSVQASNFGAMFDKTTSNKGVLSGNEAKQIFLKARLPIPILENIWNLVDQNENGQLTKPQFIVAMHLIQCFMNKSLAVLPSALSDQLWKVAESACSTTQQSQLSPPAVPLPRSNIQPVATNPVAIPPAAATSPISSLSTNLNTWIMSSQQKKQYGAIFDTLDTEKKSFISSGTVANFLMTSKLSNQILANIWELANLDQSDNFTKQEFSIAMYLVQKKLAGYDLPDETPSELIQSSTIENELKPQPSQYQSVQPPQNFETVQRNSAPQRTASHMDDLLGIFQTVQPVQPQSSAPLPELPTQQQHHQQPPPPAPSSRLSNSFTVDNTNMNANFVPTSSFGKGLQKSATIAETNNDESSSSDDDDGPENLDLPRVRGTPPAIPGRSNKPHFESVENISTPSPINYDAIKAVNENPSSPSMFSNQPSIGSFTNTAAAATGAAIGAAVGFTGAALGSFSNSASTDNSRDISNQITQTSVDIGNYSNQINSLSKQASIVSSKKDKAQNDLNKLLKSKDDMLVKLNQLKELNEKETQQVLEVQNLMIKSKDENDQLQKDLSIAEANYHAQQTKKEQLQALYDESQKANQSQKEKLGTLNIESQDLNQQIEEFENKLRQSNNLLAVTQQQVATQETANEELKLKVNEISNSIFQVDQKQQLLLTKIGQLNDENLDLHEKHTDLSIQSANKNIDYSQTFAHAASKGLVNDEDVEEGEGDKEVPTASLDDFDDLDIAKKSSVIPEPSVTNSENSNLMSEALTENTSSTQLESNEGTSNVGVTPTTDFTLPFNSPHSTHSTTSSTINNPSQSVRGEQEDGANDEHKDVEQVSASSTIEESVPLSSQILPESAIEESDEANNKYVHDVEGPDKSESFEFVNHPQEKEVEKAAIVPSKEEVATVAAAFPPIQQLEPLDDDTSSDDDFQDANVKPVDVPAQIEVPVEVPVAAPVEDFAEDLAKAPVEPVEDIQTEGAEIKTVPSGNNNPFGQHNFDDLTPAVDNGPLMFDDLGLETAQVEPTNTEFDSAANTSFSNVGFSFSTANNNIEDGLTTAAVNDGDDWEQVFAGFGNDPNLQPAQIEENSAVYDSSFSEPTAFSYTASAPIVQHAVENVQGTSSVFSNAQKLAIEELSDMGFNEDEAISALQQHNWSIDDASNYLLDKA